MQRVRHGLSLVQTYSNKAHYQRCRLRLACCHRKLAALLPGPPTNTPACVNIGKASPTGILAGYKSRFPQQYRNAIFALDWTYGRILTIHLTPDGASYTGRPEVFLRGRPLNVTDADFGPDGAMYFVTGGRSTQSALYRVTYTGRIIVSPEKTPQEKMGEKVARSCRKILHNLERYHQAWVGKLQNSQLTLKTPGSAMPQELPSNISWPRPEMLILISSLILNCSVSCSGTCRHPRHNICQ